MSRKEFIEFNKYLAMLIYEYTLIYQSSNLTIEMYKEVRKILSALKLIQNSCLIEGNKYNE